jgi:hypothetical protein
VSDISRNLAKRTLVWLLYRQGWERQRVLDRFGILDGMMRLPPALAEQRWPDLHTLEGKIKMPYVTSVERMPTERGNKKGIEQGIEQGFQRGELKGRFEGQVATLAEVFEGH